MVMNGYSVEEPVLNIALSKHIKGNYSGSGDFLVHLNEDGTVKQVEVVSIELNNSINLLYD